jgi:hypothetical protein
MQLSSSRSRCFAEVGYRGALGVATAAAAEGASRATHSVSQSVEKREARILTQSVLV